MNDALAAVLVPVSIAAGTFGIFFGMSYSFNYGTSEHNYRQSFDRVIECRRFTTKSDIDTVCGKLPQWSDFVKEEKND